MTGISRRQALTLGLGAAAAVAVAPAAVAALSAPAPLVSGTAWAVGTPGEFNFQAIFAATEEEAIAGWLAEYGVAGECEQGGPAGVKEDCDCEACYYARELEPARMPEWDGKSEVSSGDWISVGWGAHCSRCGEECFGDDGARSVAGKAVCGDCVTLADLDLVDPAAAADRRAEEAEA